MSDEKSRSLERKWQESGSLKAYKLYLQEKARQGEAFETCILDLDLYGMGCDSKVYFFEDNTITCEPFSLEPLREFPEHLPGPKVLFVDNKLHLLETRPSHLSSIGNVLTSIDKEGQYQRRTLVLTSNGLINIDGELGIIHRHVSNNNINRGSYLTINKKVIPEDNYIPGNVIDKIGDEFLRFIHGIKKEVSLCTIENYVKGSFTARPFFIEDENLYVQPVSNEDRSFYQDWFFDFARKNMIKGVPISINEDSFIIRSYPSHTRLANQIWYAKDEKSLMRSYSSQGQLSLLEANQSVIKGILKHIKEGTLEEITEHVR